MATKVKFIFSPVYNNFFEKFVKFPENGKKYPDSKVVIKKMKSLEEEWNKVSDKILNSLSKFTGLKWQEKTINCYFVGKCMPFSDPLTICPKKNNKDTINLLVHELIHQLIFQNRANKKVKKMWKNLEKKYKKESRLTINHIIVHAIHSKIYLEYFNKKELDGNIKWDKKNKNYARSWEIVNDVGYEKIINLIRT